MHYDLQGKKNPVGSVAVYDHTRPRWVHLILLPATAVSGGSIPARSIKLLHRCVSQISLQGIHDLRVSASSDALGVIGKVISDLVGSARCIRNAVHLLIGTTDNPLSISYQRSSTERERSVV